MTFTTNGKGIAVSCNEGHTGTVSTCCTNTGFGHPEDVHYSYGFCVIKNIGDGMFEFILSGRQKTGATQYNQQTINILELPKSNKIYKVMFSASGYGSCQMKKGNIHIYVR